MTSRTEIERLRALAKEVDGCWRVYEAGLREVMGHTNYNVIARKLADEQSVQYPSPRDDFSPENNPFKMHK